MRRFAAAGAALVALALAPGAGAAYNPGFLVTADPATPSAPAAVTATVTQQSGESATASQRVRFPPTFRFNPSFDVAPCPPQAEQAQSCPESSVLGHASAQTSFGEFAGNVHLAADYRLVIFLRGFGGAIQQKVVGHLILHPDGSVETVMEDLPNVQSTLGRVSLLGGSKSLILTPSGCGTHAVNAVFTSHDGDRAERTFPLAVAGCDTRPRILVAQASPTRVRRSAPRTTLTWRLTEPGSATVVSIRRVVRSGRFDRLREEMVVRAGSHGGRNRVVLDLRRGGRPLPRGDYRARLTSLSAQGREADTITVGFRIGQ